MAKAYSVNGPNASGSANKSMVTLVGGTTVRPRLFDLILGNSQSPADQASISYVGRFTAAGTAGSTPTPLPVDPGDVASLSTAGITHSVEPTYTAGGTLLAIPLNQRASFRWVASPGYELLGAATASNGVGTYLSSATTAMILSATVLFQE